MVKLCGVCRVSKEEGVVGGGDKKVLCVVKYCGLDGWREMGGKNRKLKFYDYEKENGIKKNRN